MSSETLTLASLNAEYGQFGPHAEQFLGFVLQYAPQILLLQEIFPEDIETLLRVGPYTDAVFLPQANFRERVSNRLNGVGKWGIGIVTNQNLTAAHKDYYLGSEETVPNVNEERYIPSRGVLSAQISTASGSEVRVGNIHYIWTYHGENTLEQKYTLRKVNSITTTRKLDILAGDFNIPRDSQLGRELSQEYFYKSHVPECVTTTLDNERHRSSDIPHHVVDYLLSTGGNWRVNDHSIQIISGVSDHCAIVGEIEKE